MDGIINVRVNGYSIAKDGNCAGAQHEVYSAKLRIFFSDDWLGFVKTITFWNALGENPVKVVLGEHLADGENVYLVSIPGEAMTEVGFFTFTIDGYDEKAYGEEGNYEGVRKRSVEEKLKVLPSRKDNHAGEPQDATPEPYEQLQKELESIAKDILDTNTRVDGKADMEEVCNLSADLGTLATRINELDGVIEKEVNPAINTKADKEDTYTKKEVDHRDDILSQHLDTVESNILTALDTKADKEDIYPKTEIEERLPKTIPLDSSININTLYGHQYLTNPTMYLIQSNGYGQSEFLFVYSSAKMIPPDYMEEEFATYQVKFSSGGVQYRVNMDWYHQQWSEWLSYATTKDIENKADKEDTYTKEEVDEKIALKGFEKQFSTEDWVDGVLQIPYEEHQKEHPVVSVFCHRYDYEVYVSDEVCSSSGCGGYGEAHPIHPETKEEGSFSNWFTPCAKTVSRKCYCTSCISSWTSKEPHPYLVKQEQIVCPVAVDEDNNITLQSDISFNGKVIVK